MSGAGSAQAVAALHSIARRLRASTKTSIIMLTGSDDVVDRLVPQGTYAELPDVLASWYDGVCDGIALDTPPNPDDDDEFAAMIRRVKSIPGRVTGRSPT